MEMAVKIPLGILCNAAITLQLNFFLWLTYLHGNSGFQTNSVTYLSELLVGLLQVRGFTQMFIRVQVDVRVVLALWRVAVALLALLEALWVRLLVVLFPLPVWLVWVQVRVFQMVAVIEPGGKADMVLKHETLCMNNIFVVQTLFPTHWKPWILWARRRL